MVLSNLDFALLLRCLNQSTYDTSLSTQLRLFTNFSPGIFEERELRMSSEQHCNSQTKSIFIYIMCMQRLNCPLVTFHAGSLSHYHANAISTTITFKMFSRRNKGNRPARGSSSYPLHPQAIRVPCSAGPCHRCPNIADHDNYRRDQLGVPAGSYPEPKWLLRVIARNQHL
ncbi:uncharacterized protein EI90DRAFT_2416890 [Cantharellus anzutake]|uniref:uncharacterized protein n=1 Tax=Cantharellus anzutake TaxID=1750568 RepID=UPI001906935D|nr:uncharacterized protein EI90DRAFT_2416890 [Cantharellus anzutake]KAF8338803.1 hypothetical protein EI90DRAFT_2416890 [Cantharellus anzutake]